MRRLALVALASIALGGCDFGGEEEKSELQGAEYVANLDDRTTEDPDDDLGGVGMTAEGQKTRITISVRNPRVPRQQAEIRQGNCDVLGMAVAYPLRHVENGTSQTVIDVPLRDLRRAGYVVTVHDVASEARLGSVCADLAKAQPPDAAPTFD